MRSAILNLEASKIREVANAGLGRTDVLAFWFGESDEVTPDFIRQAAMDSLQQGETFYAHNLGLPSLRQAIAQTMTARHGPAVGGATIGAERIAVTSGGVNALMLAVQALVDAGDEVVAVTPIWPNLTAQPLIMGAQLKTVSLVPRAGAWTLDLQALLAAVTAKTRLLILNAPNNPTGWTLTADEQGAILTHCRRTGTWILADEVYESLYYEPSAQHCAPSFLDRAEPEDRLMVAHSFSKSFLMTGWRLGWLVVPESLVPVIERLAQNLFICPSTVAQHAALACFDSDSLALYEQRRQEFKARRDYFIPALRQLGLSVPVMPDGAFYAWADCRALCQRLGLRDSWDFSFEVMRRAHVAITPGRDFGQAQTKHFVRFSTASSMPALQQAVQRLQQMLEAA